MDYRLTDVVGDPPGVPPRMTETPVRMTGFCCYQPPASAPPVGPLPMLKSDRITFGSLNGLKKLIDPTLDAWAELLRRLPVARLLVARSDLTSDGREFLLGRFRDRGVDPGQIVIGKIGGRDRGHLAVYHAIDVALDPFPWNGHTTACESLWMGVPVVALLGNRFSSRMVASVLTRIDLTELIAESVENYIQTALTLVSQVSRLAGIRQSLRETMAGSPLCDGARFTVELERAYREMWHTWCAEGAASRSVSGRLAS